MEGQKKKKKKQTATKTTTTRRKRRRKKDKAPVRIAGPCALSSATCHTRTLGEKREVEGEIGKELSQTKKLLFKKRGQP